MSSPFKIESLLAARLFLSPQLVGKRVFFLSDLSGRISLYAMDKGGSVPEPLLPPDIALQNPALMDAESFYVFPRLDKILVMIDQDGDENYQPCFVPLAGGLPEPVFGARFEGQQVNCVHCDPVQNLAALQVDPRTSPIHEAYLANMETLELTGLGTSRYGNLYEGATGDHGKVILTDGYAFGDNVVYLWEKTVGERRLLYGKPLDQRAEGEKVPLNSIFSCHFVAGDQGLLFGTSLFDDGYGLGYLALDTPETVQRVEIAGTVHEGTGEFYALKHLKDDRFLISYNIDGCSWAYEGVFDAEALQFRAERVVCGQRALSDGVLQSIHFEKASGNYVLSFSTATSAVQIYTVEGPDEEIIQHTRERILGIRQDLLAAGEDASYTSHDGLRVSARLYMPAERLGFEGVRPVIFYIHGGPQSQERPDFAWFSMPLIQYLTLNGFAVFVPNVRGSTGYGLAYMKRVDLDWGGQDRLDHVAAFDHLRQDDRLDLDRTGVMGRSYGGYMTLMLAGWHPDLWKAACDMFGPYNLFTFMDRLPETWQTYFHLAVGHPEKDRELLTERSPHTHLHRLACPMLVVQGANDPRVLEAESRDLVEELRGQGKEVDLLVFENEGHDVLKFENKVRCYNEITEFFARLLEP